MIRHTFGNPFCIIDVPLDPVTIIEKVSACLFPNDDYDLNINDVKCTIEERALSNALFKLFIYGSNKYQSLMIITPKLYYYHIADLVSKSNFLGTYVPFMIRFFYNQFTPLKNHFENFFSCVEDLCCGSEKISKFNQSINYELNNYNRTRFTVTNTIYHFILISRQIDLMIYTTFETYISLQKGHNSLIKIYDQFKLFFHEFIGYSEFRNVYVEIRDDNYYGPEMHDYCPKYIDYRRYHKDIRQIIFALYGHLESILNQAIRFKLICLESLEDELKYQRISKELYKKFETYFTSAFTLENLKQKLINNVKMTYLKNQSSKNVPMFNNFEDTVIPNVLRDCHFTLLAQRDEFFKGNFSYYSHYLCGKQTLKDYKNMPHLNLTPGILKIYVKINEASDAIKRYINKNPDEFFPKQIRYELRKLSEEESNNYESFCRKIVQIFNKLNLKQKSMVIFVFDHIICFSTETHDDFNSLNKQLNEFAKLMISVKSLNGRLVFLFRHIFDMYRTGILIMPQMIIDLTTVVEETFFEIHYQAHRSIQEINYKKIPIETINSLIETYQNKSLSIRYLRNYCSFDLMKCIRQCLDEMNLVLPNDFKTRVIRSSMIRQNNEIDFVDSVLVDAFMHVPKIFRIPIGYMISHILKLDKYLNIEKIAESYAPYLFKYIKENDDPPYIRKLLSKAFYRLINIHKYSKSTLDFVEFEKEIDFDPEEQTEDLLKYLYPIIEKSPKTVVSLSFKHNVKDDSPEFIIIRPFDLVKFDYLLENYPAIEYENPKREYHTYVLIDPDATHNKDPKSDCVLHLFVGNLTGTTNHVDYRSLPHLKDTVMVPYIPPVSKKGSGVHRYVLLLYRQNKIEDYSFVNDLQDYDINKRKHFNLKLIENDYKLELVGANFFFCGHDYDINQIYTLDKIFDDENSTIKHKSKLIQPTNEDENKNVDEEYETKLKNFINKHTAAARMFRCMKNP